MEQIYLVFLKQNAKLDWLKDGDENTTLFHHYLSKLEEKRITYIA